jgi:phosphate starvation-inducible PhoH-like protein
MAVIIKKIVKYMYCVVIIKGCIMLFSSFFLIALKRTITPNQNKYILALKNWSLPIVIGTGPSGTGKTFFACQQAATDLLDGNIEKIILTRPTVTVNSEDFGFLPGGIENKMDPFMQPIFDVLKEKINECKLNTLIKNRKIEVCPLAFMRGRTFKNSFIIADEMQNSNMSQMKMLLTRLGDGSRLVVTGDVLQSDIRGYDGLSDLIKRCNYAQDPLIQCFTLDDEDIIRSRTCQSVLKLYNHL